MVVVSAEKCNLCRASGTKLFLKGTHCSAGKCPIDKKGAVQPGQHGAKRRRRLSDFGIKLKEAQKLKKIYGLEEKQLKRYFAEARKNKEATATALLQILESRLDNLVFRLGLAPSRRSARQLVGHKHVTVDGKSVNVPSYRVRPGQVITIDNKAQNIAEVKQLLDDKNFALPEWLERKAVVGKLGRLPERTEIEIDVNDQLIVEYYSR